MKSFLFVLVFCLSAFSATWFVRPATHGGNDDSTGTTFAKAKATLQCGYDSIAAGDTLRICGDSATWTYTLGASLDVDMNASAHAQGTVTSKIRVFGADTIDGSIYNGTGRVLITTSSTLANGLLAFDSVATYIEHYDLILNGGGVGKAEYCLATTRAGDKCVGNSFINMRFTNADNHGVYYRAIAGSVGKLYFERCEIDNNGKGGTGWGMTAPSFTTRTSWDLISCSIHDNPSGGAIVAFYTIIRNNKFYDNGGDGLQMPNAVAASTQIIENNLFIANDGDGCDIAVLGGGLLTFTGNISKSNGGYGYNFNGSAVDRFHRIDYNCVNGNSTNPTDINSNALPGAHNVTGDPLFESETDGSEDFRLQSGSPCLNADIITIGF